MTGRDLSVDFEDDGASFPRRRLRFLADLQSRTEAVRPTVSRWLIIGPLLLIFTTAAAFGVMLLFTAAYAVVFG